MAKGRKSKSADNAQWLSETRQRAESKESEGATDRKYKKTDADKRLEKESGTPGQASKQFQALSDAEKNLYEKALSEAGRPHPVAKEGEKQL